MLESLGNRKFDCAVFVYCQDIKFIENICRNYLHTTGRAIIINPTFIIDFAIPLEMLNGSGKQVRWIVNNLEESIAQIHEFELIDFVYMDTLDEAKISLLSSRLKKSAVIITKDQIC